VECRKHFRGTPTTCGRPSARSRLGSGKETRIMKPIYVIVGPTGSGKTTVAKAIGKRFELPVINIGDLLASRLEKVPLDRREIGPEFVSRFGLDAYHEFVLATVKSSIIVDGLRSPDLLEMLILRSSERTKERILTIYCESSEVTPKLDPYYDWVSKLASIAARTIPWFASSDGPVLKEHSAIAIAEEIVTMSTTQEIEDRSPLKVRF